MNKSASSDLQIKQNQMFKALSWLAFFAVVAFGGFFVSSILRPFGESSRIHGLAMAQSVGYQAWELAKRHAAVDTGRGPASVSPGDLSAGSAPIEGDLGQTQSGRPFHYKIRTEGGQHIVDVWSDDIDPIRTQVLIPTETD